ncbi:prophage protein [Lactococcus cremoris subsp. cremoris A76]|nr:prophage protein [Lactococcus cremoris subsp. cremoris A76]
MGLSERTVSLKLNDKVTWKDDEILKAVHVLELNPQDIPKYFFNAKVH